LRESKKMGNEMRKRVIRANKSWLVVFFLLSGLCFNAVAQDVAVFPQLGHSDYINSVAFTPDGMQFLLGSDDGTIKLWDINSGKVIRTFSGHSDSVASVAFSPDGKYVLSGSDDRTVKLWDVSSGLEIRTFSGHTDSVVSVVYSPDGKYILSGSWDKTVGSDNNQLVCALQDNSTVIFTASRGSECSQEIKELKHGVFTYAIIQGLKGEADLFKKGQITMKELDTYVSEMVPKLTKGLQHPTTSTPDGCINFVVADLK